jgi:hypothetical protein
VTPTISKWADDTQNGFAAGRQGINNVVTLDAQARIADLHAHPTQKFPAHLLPALTLYDFCAAFPSIAHKFIFLILTAIGLPNGLTEFFRGLYHNNRCYGTFDGETVSLHKKILV